MDASTEQSPQQLIDGLIDSTWAFSALSTALEAGLLDALASRCTAADAATKSGMNEDLTRGLLDVLVALGLAQRENDRYAMTPAFSEFWRTSDREDLLAWLRSSHFQSRQMVDEARQGHLVPGWIHTDPEILQAQGRTGRATTQSLAQQVFPMLPGLDQRLRSPGAAFLDVGMGVGIISIELCSIYPHLHVVGLEPGEVQAGEAQRNISAAGFEDRIEVRPQRLEDLSDSAAYDLAYLPQVFMPKDVVVAGLRKVWEALRPGGWILVAAMGAPGDDLHAARTRLLNILWGGSPLSAEEVAEMTRTAGFEAVQIGGQPHSLIKGIVGRRPLNDE